MLSKEAIRKTVVCAWSQDDECFIAVSALFPRITGTGDSFVDAIADFESVLDDAYDLLVKGKVLGYSQKGRPAKGGTDMHVSVRPSTKQFINAFREGINISQGEVIDYLVKAHECNKQNTPLFHVTIDTGNSKIFISDSYLPCVETPPNSGSGTSNVLSLRRAGQGPLAA